ncbi:MAG: serine hydrolase [Dysgonamonadaceae bacterium]|jgi:beta-glucosidase-like glycosyl hydrolase/CubicO group peptidase (beta-lactamase class C family)|nr:serine hydrolase [Dysgonamonadaceae bacterium]
MTKTYLLTLIGWLIIIPLTYAQKQPALYQLADAAKMKHWVDSIFDTMTLDEKIGQLFMVAADPSLSNSDKTLKYIREQKIGGIIFFKGALEDEAQSINLYGQSSRVPLLISLDGEWGLSMRLENTPRFPKSMMLGAIADNHLIQLYGAEVGRECRELGIHINFAPVLDVNSNPDNPVIGIRSFGENQRLVVEKAIAYSRGLESYGVMAVGKHFPGHGDTSKDSHKTLPVVDNTWRHINDIDLYPFRAFIEAGFSGIMTGHLSVPALDKTSRLPTSLSPKIVDKLLKKELKFKGLTFTDALNMKGASIKKSNCVQALIAGNDILLYPEDPASEIAEVKRAVELGVINLSTVEKRCLKVLSYKYAAGLNNPKPVEINGLNERINSDYSKWLVQKLNSEAITLLKNEDEQIPVKGLGRKKIAVLSIGAKDEIAFRNRLSLYGAFDFFSLPSTEVKTGVTNVFRQLKDYDEIICTVYSAKQTDFPELQRLAKTRDVSLCFFTLPYSIARFKQSAVAAKSVIAAYEDTPGAQQAAAELIMGGIPAKGKLPVSIAGLFDFGDGLKTQKVRLSYQEAIEADMSPETLRKIEAIVSEGINSQAFPGCQVLVAKDGVVVYNRSFGAFDYTAERPVLNTDIYDIASLTKAVATLAAIMKLHDTKKIALSDKISRFVPELKYSDKKNLTIQSALFHETRLPAFILFYRLLTGTMVSSQPAPGIEKQVADRLYIKSDFQKDIMNEIVNAKRSNKNGYLYSDLNFMLLKEVVENSSGQTLDNFLDHWLYAGLGANFTGFLPLRKFPKENIAPTEYDEIWRKQLLTGYPHDEAAAAMGGVSGNAGLFSNANDLAKILQMLLYGGEYGDEKYLSRETVKLFTKTQSAHSHRGLGFDRPDPKNPGKGACLSASASVYGHTGYTGTCFWVDPDKNLIYIFLSNRVYPSRKNRQLIQLNIRERIQDVIYESINNFKYSES